VILEEVTKRRDVNLAALRHGGDDGAGRPLLHRHLMERTIHRNRECNELGITIWLLIGAFVIFTYQLICVASSTSGCRECICTVQQEKCIQKMKDHGLRLPVIYLVDLCYDMYDTDKLVQKQASIGFFVWACNTAEMIEVMH